MSLLLAPFRIVAIPLGLLAKALRHHFGLFFLGGSAAVGLVAVILLLATFERPSVVGVQTGYRGSGMIHTYNPRLLQQVVDVNRIDAALPPVTPAGKPSSAVYKNVKVLGDVDANEFLRLMAAMTDWVAPKTGCSFCHSTQNMADDAVYTKQVARRMIQMTQMLNANWRQHVGTTGVTCNTCHRGHPIPAGVWFTEPPPAGASGMAETTAGKNTPSVAAGLTSLPYDPFTPFLLNAETIRVQATTALRTDNDRMSINQTDWTYALMIHFSKSLGQSCNFCHNSRAFAEWDQGTPHRVTAWSGIPMTRDLNRSVMESLRTTFPPGLLGKLGDVPKISCVTCHNGAYKPFYGASNLSSYPELEGQGPLASAAGQP